MDDFDKSLEVLIKQSADIVTLEDELRKLSKENKEDTPEFKEKAKELRTLLNFEYELLDTISIEGLNEINNRIANKYQEKAEAIEANNAAGRLPLEGIDPNLETPLERLDIIISEILENEEEEYVQCFDSDDNDNEEELDGEDDFDENPDEDDKEELEEEYDEERLEKLSKAADEIERIASSLPETSKKNEALIKNYTAHRLEDKQEKKYYKYMIIRSTIIAFKKLYYTIMRTPVSTETEQMYKNDLLQYLQEYKYIVFLKTPELEKIAIEHSFDIYSIPTPPLPEKDISALIHNQCMINISSLYETRIDTIDIETILECTKELLEILEHIDYLDNQSLNNLISYCEGIKETLSDNNFGTYAIRAIKRKIKKNTNGGQNERRESN